MSPDISPARSLSLSRRDAIAAISSAAVITLFSRSLLAKPAAAAAAPGPTPAKAPKPTKPEDIFTISLAQWSLHKALFAKQLDHLDFPKTAKNDYGIDGLEYVNQFWAKKGDDAYTNELKKRCSDLGVTSVLIMCDGEGNLGDPDEAKRKAAVNNHKKWLDAAKTLGCHCIRVNAYSEGTFEEKQKLAADGLHQLCELANPYNLNVIVENHGGVTSNGKWLTGMIKLANSPRAGLLPDFGNFTVSKTEEYDRYLGVTEMMAYAKGVSAKSHDFDDKTGAETAKDYPRLMKIVYDAGYRGRVGIEYEGSRLGEPEGIRATKVLLEKIRAEMFKTLTA